jgi:hypothetical protein
MSSISNNSLEDDNVETKSYFIHCVYNQFKFILIKKKWMSSFSNDSLEDDNVEPKTFLIHFVFILKFFSNSS